MSTPTPATPSPLLPHILPFLTPHLPPRTPLTIAISGPQGSGKSTLAATLATTLRLPPYSLTVATLSIDDLYLPHSAQQSLAPHNALLRHRGNPGTHDLPLALRTLRALRAGEAGVPLPRYDKSAFGGEGDRVPEERWERVGPVDVVLWEGWCVGFRSVGEEGVRGREEGLEEVDRELRAYKGIDEMVDLLVHLDAEDIGIVYEWRKQQEREMGQGMTEDQVERFVDAYMPAYRVYVPGLRRGALEKGRQLRIVLGRMREVKAVEVV